MEPQRQVPVAVDEQALNARRERPRDCERGGQLGNLEHAAELGEHPDDAR